MNKSKTLNAWLWKWHIIAGLFCTPFMIVLAVTGSIYLFKGYFNDYVYSDARFIRVEQGVSITSYTDQLLTAQQNAEGHIMSVTVPTSPDQATAFRQHGKGHATNLIYVDPYTNEVTGSYQQKQTFMYKVRKLHGELLLGKKGSLVVELVASWFVVMFLTGIYVWWPFKGFSLKGYFTIRTDKSSRLKWRDLHAVIGFWVSLFMLAIIAGGMPWTELFGDQLKWVQAKTDTGYPQHWRNARGLESISPASLNGIDLQGSTHTNHAATPVFTIDQVINNEAVSKLDGQITVTLPRNQTDVYTIKNRAFWLRDQEVIHLDQHTGKTIKALAWQDVGILMKTRQLFMRFHQGEYGLANLVIVLVVVLLFLFSLIASIVSYFKRKPKGRLGLPKVPEGFKLSLLLVVGIISLGILFPAFGISLVIIFLVEKVWVLKSKLTTSNTN